MDDAQSQAEAERLRNCSKGAAKMQVIRRLAEANDAICDAIKAAQRNIRLQDYSTLHQISESLEELAYDLMSKP